MYSYQRSRGHVFSAVVDRISLYSLSRTPRVHCWCLHHVGLLLCAAPMRDDEAVLCGASAGHVLDASTDMSRTGLVRLSWCTARCATAAAAAPATVSHLARRRRPRRGGDSPQPSVPLAPLARQRAARGLQSLARHLPALSRGFDCRPRRLISASLVSPLAPRLSKLRFLGFMPTSSRKPGI